METNNSYERLEKVIKWANLSTHAFALKIGMRRSENLYRIIREKTNVSIKLSVKIIETYPEISRDWLIYGMGEMLNKEEFFTSNKLIPFYENQKIEPEFNLLIPIFSADKAVRMTDKAMETLIPMGAIVAVEKQTPDMIIFGKIYYVQTEEFTVIRMIRKGDLSDDVLILKVMNDKHYDDMTISKDKIINIYLVRGVINHLF